MLAPAKKLRHSGKNFTLALACELLSWCSQTCALRCFLFSVIEATGKNFPQLGSGKLNDSSCNKYVTKYVGRRSISLSKRRQLKWKRLDIKGFRLFKHPIWEMPALAIEGKEVLERFLKENFKRFSNPIFFFNEQQKTITFKKVYATKENLSRINTLDMLAYYLYLLRREDAEFNYVTGNSIKEDALLLLIRLVSFHPFDKIAEDVVQLFLPFLFSPEELNKKPYLISDILTGDIDYQLKEIFSSIGARSSSSQISSLREHIQLNQQLVKLAKQSQCFPEFPSNELAIIYFADRTDKKQACLEFSALCEDSSHRVRIAEWIIINFYIREYGDVWGHCDRNEIRRHRSDPCRVFWRQFANSYFTPLQSRNNPQH